MEGGPRGVSEGQDSWSAAKPVMMRSAVAREVASRTLCAWQTRMRARMSGSWGTAVSALSRQGRGKRGEVQPDFRGSL